MQKIKWIVIGILLLFIGAGSVFAAYHYGLFTLPLKSATTSPAESTTASSTVTTSTATATNTVCDNYQCLIAAASQCQPLSVIISYSMEPTIGFYASGQIKYEIKKSSGVNDCTLIYSSPVTSLSISDEGRAAALAKGMTDAQIIAEMQTINNSLKSEAGIHITCPSDTSVISAYLTDSKSNPARNIASGIWYGGKSTIGQPRNFTTSSGQKLACTVTSL